MPPRLTVVVSQSPSQNPKKHALEEAIVVPLLSEPGIEVAVVPHIYNLTPEGPALLSLANIPGDLVLCGWLFPRATHWTLACQGIRGQVGETLLRAYGEGNEDDHGTPSEQQQGVIDPRDLPTRKIYSLDLRAYDSADPYLEEIRRIAQENATDVAPLMQWINGAPKKESLSRYLNPEERRPATSTPPPNAKAPNGSPAGVPEESASRRWYPVIDYSRCTNCMECIDFCLFGVYGLGVQETLLVEQPDNCRKGCPACSRVCPENAILFPQHKTPPIAGSAEAVETMKLDLSKLFGAPDPGAPGAEGAIDIAVQERDEQLLLAGRDSVGKEVGIAKRQGDNPQKSSDELDCLVDQFDELDL